MSAPTALVTGGSRGIGLGIAEALLDAGYAVAINGRRPPEEVAELTDRLARRGTVVYLRGDVATADDRQRILTELYDRFGRLNLLVNNAGVAPRERGDLLDMSGESYDRVMDINLRGPFFLTQAAARRMIADAEDPDYRGCIVNVSSISATVASINRGQYCLSKAGMSMMTKLFAIRLAPAGIPVYELRPGIIKTDMTSGVTEKYDRLIADGLTLQPRWGETDDIGRAVVALATGSFPYSTGGVFMLDGGLTVARL